MSLRRSALAIVLAGAAGACADLQPIEAGLCGNLIVETGEDCDGDDALGVCRTPLQPDSCRYDCSGTRICPTNLVCGAGLVCRTPDVCGNGVTEPEAGEHCDGESSLGVCRPANQPGACQFDCTTANCPAGFECTEVGLCTNQDVCGNGILEQGEDCDGPSTPEGASCRGPGGEGECRFDCTENAVCPVGFGCGVDGVCRAPAGTFVIGDPQLGETLGLALGDFDDDGQGELVHVTIDGFHIRELSSLLNTGTVVPAAPAPPIIGDINGDEIDDLAFRIPSKFVNGAGELAVFLSNADGDLAPLIQYTENLPGFGVALDVLPSSANSDLVFVNQVQAHGYSFEADVAAVTPTVTFGLTSLLQSGFPQPSSQLLGVGVADFRRNTLAPCDELAIAWRNVGSAVVITPCVVQTFPQVPPWNTQVIAPTVVVFPPGHLPWPVGTGPNPGGAVFAGDVNGDGAPDLLIPTDSPPPPCTLTNCSLPDMSQCKCHGCVDNGICGVLEDCVCNDCAGDLDCNYPGAKCDVDGQCEPGSEGCGCPDCAAHPTCPGPKSLQVSYGVGDGSFHSVLPVPLGSGDNKTSSLVYERLPNFQCPDQRGPLASETLAVADLNEDSLADLVTGHGIYVTLPTGALAYTFCPQDDWKEAVVADLDGNGTLDVFAKGATTTLQYLSGVGDGTFSSQAIAAGGFPFGLVAADVDGDTLGDVAFLRSDVPGPSATGLRDVMVAFGRPFSAPSQPVVVGRARDANRLLAGRMLFGDGAAELVVQRPVGGTNTAVMRGGIARQLVSPLVLRSGTALPAFATHEQVTSLESLVYGNFRTDHATTRFVFAALSARFGTDHRVELISSESGEQLVHWHATPFDCQAPGGPCPLWRLGAVDLDGDAEDSVVAFRDGELVVFTEATAPQVAQRFDTGFDLFEGTRGDVHAAMVGKPWVTDIDADGFEDVAVLGSLGEVHILWNDGSGQLSMDRYTLIASPDPFLAFAFLQTQGDDKLELATIGAQGIEFRALDADHEFGAALALVDGPTGDILVAGDFSGDGVDDIVVGDALSFTLLFGESKQP